MAEKFGFKFESQTLHLFKPELDHMLNDPSGDVGQYLDRIGREIVLAAKAQVGVDTGRLRDAIKLIHYRETVGQYIWVGADVGHALVHHEGSRPHVINRENQNVMRFPKGGRMVFSHQVMHPGTRPNRYLSDQLRLVQR
jgi:hypothetical protein